MRILLALLFLAFFGQTVVAGNEIHSWELPAEKDEIELLRQRLIDDALLRRGFVLTTQQYTSTEFGKGRDYLHALQPDGSWADVEYSDQDNEWSPLIALDRMLVMTYDYQQETSPLFRDSKMLDGMVRALSYWYLVAPHCQNWYKNQIAKQFYFNVIALLLQDHIGENLLSKMVNDLTESPRMTGSNKTLLSISVFYRGVIEKNEERIRAGVAGVKDQIEISLEEGIQPDFSFHQHGPFIYNGSYGHNFLRETSWLGSIIQGTSYAYSEAQMQILRDYFWEGTRWMVRGQLLDYNVRGRQVGRSANQDLGAIKIIPQLDRLMMADPEYRDQYLDAKNRIREGRPQDLLGNRHFWRSDYTAHHRPEYFTSLKMCSDRTVGMEMDVNTENLYGYYLPFGLTYLYRRGDEYLEIFPVWNWARLPGVTSPHQEFPSEGQSTQQTTFVGGVSDGTYGLSSMDLEVQETKAKKSWFWFDREWVALGAGIRSGHEAPIVTGINQALLHGPVVVDGREFSGSQQKIRGTSWVWHDGVAYIFPKGKEVMIKAEEQQGHLQKIFGLGKDTVYRSDVFSLWLDHGRQPEKENYTYVVVPGVSRKEADRYHRKIPITFHFNTAAIQALTHEKLGITAIAFHEEGKLTVGKKLEVRVDHPCLILLHHRSRRISVSDPTAGLSTLQLTIKDHKRRVFKKEVVLPQGGLAGSSLQIVWE